MVGRNRSVDNRVKKILDYLEFKYQTDSDGDFNLVFEMENGRSQIVFISSSTSMYRNLEVRDVYSPGYESDGAIPSNIANNLLEQNAVMKLGAWAKMGKFAMFISKVDANADEDTLISAIKLTTEAADQMEQEITGDKDVF